MSTDLSTLPALAGQLATIQAHLRPLQEQEAAIKAQIRDVLATLGPGEYAAGPHTVTAKATRRLDTAEVERRYPATEHPSLYKPLVDTAAVRRALPPTVVDEELTRTAGDMSVSVR